MRWRSEAFVICDFWLRASLEEWQLSVARFSRGPRFFEDDGIGFGDNPNDFTDPFTNPSTLLTPMLHRIFAAVTPLHYVMFGDELLKLFYALCTLALSAIVVSGMMIWLDKKQRGAGQCPLVISREGRERQREG